MIDLLILTSETEHKTVSSDQEITLEQAENLAEFCQLPDGTALQRKTLAEHVGEILTGKIRLEIGFKEATAGEIMNWWNDRVRKSGKEEARRQVGNEVNTIHRKIGAKLWKL